MREPRYPSLYQINARIWLTELSRTLGLPDTLDDIPEAELDRLAELGFDWIWFLSDGQWQLLECTPGWEGNWTNDCFLVFAWQGAQGESIVVAVNDAPNQSQCHVQLPFADLAGKKWQLQDQLRSTSYEWNGDDLHGKGLFLDLAPWQASVCALVKCD